MCVYSCKGYQQDVHTLLNGLNYVRLVLAYHCTCAHYLTVLDTTLATTAVNAITRRNKIIVATFPSEAMWRYTVPYLKSKSA